MESWEDGFRRFEQLPRDRRGKRVAEVDQVCDDGYRLGAWQSSQRTAYKKGKLDAVRMLTLERAGFVWDLQEAQWLTGIAALRAYPAGDDGRRHVPSGHVDPDSGFRLGSWLHNQRQHRKKGLLSKVKETRPPRRATPPPPAPLCNLPMLTPPRVCARVTRPVWIALCLPDSPAVRAL